MYREVDRGGVQVGSRAVRAARSATEGCVIILADRGTRHAAWRRVESTKWERGCGKLEMKEGSGQEAGGYR